MTLTEKIRIISQEVENFRSVMNSGSRGYFDTKLDFHLDRMKAKIKERISKIEIAEEDFKVKCRDCGNEMNNEDKRNYGAFGLCNHCMWDRLNEDMDDFSG